MRKVFLGGSCGGSDWRRKIAIPMLDAAGIPYFDPVVPDWTPECVEIEAREKAEADFILFAIEGSTRGVASLTEVSELAATGRRLFVYIEDIPATHMLGNGSVNLIDELTFLARHVPHAGKALDAFKAYMSNEHKDLNRGRAYTRDVLRRHGVGIFDSIESATSALIRRAG